MVHSPSKPLTLEDFLALPEGETAYELINGAAIPKVSPKHFHSKTQKALLRILDDWCGDRGEVGIEWAVTLTRNEVDWVPVPDLLYVSYDRLSRDWHEDAPCPVPPELVIEIISPGQSFGEMTEKATDYLATGVLRVWVLDAKAQSVTVFAPDALPKTYRGNAAIADALLPDLYLTAEQIFQASGLTR
jgi:Uma2 family endonuclease